MKKNRSLEEMLQSTSDVLFPDAMGQRVVTLDSTDADGDTPLHVMTWRGDRVAVRAFIEAGAKIDAVGDMGQTPLHVAVLREDEVLAELFLLAGANPNVRSEFGDTPLELAELVEYATNSTQGLTCTLAGLKALLEHNVRLNLVADRFPKGPGEPYPDL